MRETRSEDGTGDARLSTPPVLDGVPTETDGAAALLHGEVGGQCAVADDVAVRWTSARVVSQVQVAGARPNVCKHHKNRLYTGNRLV